MHVCPSVFRESKREGCLRGNSRVFRSLKKDFKGELEGEPEVELKRKIKVFKEHSSFEDVA